jgi:hypothetical protein
LPGFAVSTNGLPVWLPFWQLVNLKILVTGAKLPVSRRVPPAEYCQDMGTTLLMFAVADIPGPLKAKVE